MLQNSSDSVDQQVLAGLLMRLSGQLIEMVVTSRTLVSYGCLAANGKAYYGGWPRRQIYEPQEYFHIS